MPNWAWMTAASGARKFVVQNALEMTVAAGVKVVWLTPCSVGLG